MPSGSYSDIVGRLKPEAGEPGEIVHLDGRVLGRHKGIMHYTIGQRRGLGLSLGEPLFVVGLDAERHRVVVGPREALATSKIALRDVNWLGADEIADGMDVFVKVRSTRPPQPALLLRGDAGVEVVFADAEEGVAPGQACVIYDGAEGQARVLGGGVIASGTKAQPVTGELVFA